MGSHIIFLIIPLRYQSNQLVAIQFQMQVGSTFCNLNGLAQQFQLVLVHPMSIKTIYGVHYFLQNTMDPQVSRSLYLNCANVIIQIQCINAQAEMFGAHSASYIEYICINTYVWINIHIYMNLYMYVFIYYMCVCMSLHKWNAVCRYLDNGFALMKYSPQAAAVKLQSNQKYFKFNQAKNH